MGWSWSKTRVFLRKAGVSRTSAEGVHLAKRNVLGTPVTEGLVELIDGLLLGDASIECSKVAGRLTIGQSGAHQPWIPILTKQLEHHGVISTIFSSPGGPCTIKGKLCTRKSRVSLRTRAYPWLYEQAQRWYPHGVKVVPPDVRLTPLSIAGWLCGDGVLCGKGYRFEFCTDSFSNADRAILVTRLADVYGWRIATSKRDRLVLCRQEDRDSLLAIVRDHVPECFNHKLALRPRSSFRKLDTDRTLQMKELRLLGWSIDRLAARFGMSRSGVYSALKVAGLTGTRVPRQRL